MVLSAMRQENAKIIREMIESHQLHLSAPQKRYMKLKRLIDIILSLIAMLLLALPMAVVVVLQKISSPREPVIFRQARVGKDYRCFKIYKFRTMKTSAPKTLATGELEHPEVYISRLGKWLRRLSIDELPQLINVIKGDMSLIGPRPLIPQERSIRYLRRYYGVYAVRPGITGWAQVNGRDTVDTCSKVDFDREYVKKISLAFDLRILFRTVWCVLRQAGVVEGKQESENGSLTAKPLELGEQISA